MTTIGQVPARPLAPIDEESTPVEDGEGGEGESMQEGAEEGRRPMFRKTREPALELGSTGAHEDSHPLPLLVRSLRQRKGEE